MKKDLRVIKTKASLQNSLVQLLQEKNLDKISISELCLLAEVNRGTFYLHYQGITDLFEEYFLHITEDLRKAYYEPYLLTDYKIENLNSDMVRIFHHVEKFKNFYKVVFNRKSPMMYYYRLYEIVRSYLIETLSDRNLPHSNFVASYTANAILGMIIEWIQHDFDLNPTELNKILISISKLTS